MAEAVDSQEGFLRRATVSPITVQRYTASANMVVGFLGQPLRALTLKDLDRRLSEYIENLYLGGESVSVARYALYGVAFQLDVPMRDASAFALSKKSLKGFGRKAPENSRDPPPVEVVWLLAEFMLRLLPGPLGGRAAALVWLAFDGYLRPTEALSLRKDDVYTSVTKKVLHISVVVAPRSRGTPAKNKQFDDGYTVGAHGRIEAKHIMQVLVEDTPDKELLFPDITLPLWEAWCRQFSSAEKLKISPHCLRHGGPSHDVYHHQATIQDVQWRGRWMAVESCRRYTKPAKMLRARAALTPSQLKRAEEAARHVEAQILARLGRELRNDGVAPLTRRVLGLKRAPQHLGGLSARKRLS